MDDMAYMEQALALAREAALEGEVPVGCVIALGDRVVGRGRNRRERLASVAVHVVCHSGALPHVCWGDCERPDSPGGLRSTGSQGWGMWLCV